MIEKKKNFIKHPEILGGKKAFQQYIKDNLRYPEEALQKRVEGIVQLKAEIDDNGKVRKVWVTHGIGHGCDEEAIRLIENVKFGAVKNRGVRVKSTRTFKIEFKLSQSKKTIAYNVKSTENKKENVAKDKPLNRTYGYTIKF